jgi:hypothetical protein
VDEKGRPLRIYAREHDLSNELIEEFMLLANKRVVEFIGKPRITTRKGLLFIAYMTVLMSRSCRNSPNLSNVLAISYP